MIRSKILIKNLDNYDPLKTKKVELSGICLETSEKFFTFLDYTGKIEISKSQKLDIPKKRILIFCNTYQKNKKTHLYCTDFKPIDIFESIFNTIESIEFSKMNKS